MKLGWQVWRLFTLAMLMVALRESARRPYRITSHDPHIITRIPPLTGRLDPPADEKAPHNFNELDDWEYDELWGPLRHSNSEMRRHPLVKI